LLRDAPYEDYERRRFPEELAERTAEFKVFLGVQADTAGVDPSLLDIVAEPLAAKALRTAQMTDSRDWRSLLIAYASIGSRDVREALEQ
jgi:hypothetical protein